MVTGYQCYHWFVKGITFEQCAISQITRMELLSFPSLQTEEKPGIEDFLNKCRVLLLNEIIERAVIDLRKTGSLKLPDAIIVATAQVNGLKLLTLDERLQKYLKLEVT